MYRVLDTEVGVYLRTKTSVSVSVKVFIAIRAEMLKIEIKSRKECFALASSLGCLTWDGCQNESYLKICKLIDD